MAWFNSELNYRCGHGLNVFTSSHGFPHHTWFWCMYCMCQNKNKTEHKLVLNSEILAAAGWTRTCSIYSLPLSCSWHCPPSPLLGGSPIGGGRAESAAPHPPMVPRWLAGTAGSGHKQAGHGMKSWEDEMWLGGQGLWNWSRSCDSCDSILWDGLDGPSPAMCLCAKFI